MSKKKPPSKIYVVVDNHGIPLENEPIYLRKSTAVEHAKFLTEKWGFDYSACTYSLVEPRKAKS